jgi:signal transduction histidine kinase
MRALDATAERLDQLNAELERRVAERTAQLEAANKEHRKLQLFHLARPARAAAGHRRLRADAEGGLLGQAGRRGPRLLGVVRDRAQRMGELIDELLLFSRLGRSRLPRPGSTWRRSCASVLDEIAAAGAARGRASRSARCRRPPAMPR